MNTSTSAAGGRLTVVSPRESQNAVSAFRTYVPARTLNENSPFSLVPKGPIGAPSTSTSANCCGIHASDPVFLASTCPLIVYVACGAGRNPSVLVTLCVTDWIVACGLNAYVDALRGETP